MGSIMPYLGMQVNGTPQREQEVERQRLMPSVCDPGSPMT